MTKKSNFHFDRIFYGGEILSLSEGGAKIVRDIIEKDIPNLPDCKNNIDPYQYVSEKFDKHERTIRGWGIDWSKTAGNQPQISDFLKLCNMAQSQRPAEVLRDIADKASPEQQKQSSSKALKIAANHIENLANTLRNLSEK